MPSLASLHTGQFIIKPRAVKRARAWWICMAVLGVLALYLCFEAGRYLSGYSVANAVRNEWSLRLRLAESGKRIEQLQRDINRTQMTAQVDHQSAAEMQKSLNDLQAQLQKQNEELVFYRGIVSPQGDAAAHPVVQRLNILPGRDEQHFQVQLVLIQSAQVTTTAQGTLHVTLDGAQQGQPVQLSLKELMPGQGSDSLKFSYRYFQNLTLELTLPAGFEPQNLHVQLNASGHPAQTQEFAWKTADSASSTLAQTAQPAQTG